MFFNTSLFDAIFDIRPPTHSVWNSYEEKRVRENSFITQNDDKTILEVDLPGFDETEVSVKIKRGTLYVDALKKDSKKSAKNFSGKWVIPEYLDLDSVSAILKHGVLTVTFKVLKEVDETIDVKIKLE